MFETATVSPSNFFHLLKIIWLKLTYIFSREISFHLNGRWKVQSKLLTFKYKENQNNLQMLLKSHHLIPMVTTFSSVFSFVCFILYFNCSHIQFQKFAPVVVSSKRRCIDSSGFFICYSLTRTRTVCFKFYNVANNLWQISAHFDDLQLPNMKTTKKIVRLFSRSIKLRQKNNTHR